MLLDRRLRALRRVDQPGDLAEHGIGADRHGLDLEPAVDVDGAGDHPVAGLARDRQALAGQQGFVECGPAVADPAVDRHPLARAHDDDVAGGNPGDRHLRLDAARKLRRRQRPQCCEAADRGCRARLGQAFEMLAQKDESHDGCGGFEIEMAAAGDQHDHAEQPGGGGTQHHEHIHGAVPVAQGVPGATIEAAAEAEEDRRREPGLRPTRQHQGNPGGGKYHAGEQRQGEQGCADEFEALPLEPCRVGVVGHGGIGILGGQCRAVAGLGHRAEEIAVDDRAVEHDMGALGGEVDGGGAHARDLAQTALHPAGAGGTGHALDIEIDRRVDGRWRRECGHVVIPVARSPCISARESSLTTEVPSLCWKWNHSCTTDSNCPFNPCYHTAQRCRAGTQNHVRRLEEHA